jgi:hypothetical protein
MAGCRLPRAGLPIRLTSFLLPSAAEFCRNDDEQEAKRTRRTPYWVDLLGKLPHDSTVSTLY